MLFGKWPPYKRAQRDLKIKDPDELVRGFTPRK